MKNIKRFLSIVVLVFISSAVFAQLPKTKVTVTQPPSTLTVTPTTPICPDVNGTIVVQGAELGVTYSAYVAGTTFPLNVPTKADLSASVALVSSSTIDGSGNVVLTIPKANLANGNNTFVVGGTNTCFTSLVGTATINVIPADATVAPATQTIDFGVNGALAISNFVGTSTYKVYVGGVLVAPSPVDGSGNITIPAAKLITGDNTITIEATNATGCTDTKTATITVKPTAEITGVICAGVASNITVTVTGVGPWVVKLSDGTDVNIPVPLVAPFSPVSTVVSVTVSSGPVTITSVKDASALEGTKNGSLVVNPKSTVAITADQVVCRDGSLATTIDVTLTGAFSTGTGWSFEYNKIVTDPTTGVKTTTVETPISGTTAGLTIPTGSFTKTTEYELTKVTDAKGCPVTNL